MPRPSVLMADIALCATFFTRAPLPSVKSDRSFADALWAAPVVGALVGLVVGVVLVLGLGLGLPAGVAAVLGIGAGIALTGALHEDGAADVADGFGGGKTRDDKLAIMRDSRIGAYGTLALVMSAMARWSAMAAIAATGRGDAVVWALVAAHAASRAVLPAFAARVPPARETGLSAGIGAIEPRTAWLALGLGLLCLAPFGIGFTVVAAVLLVGVFFSIEWLCRRQIGGQTGDVIGALQQVCEVMLLFALAVLLV